MAQLPFLTPPPALMFVSPGAWPVSKSRSAAGLQAPEDGGRRRAAAPTCKAPGRAPENRGGACGRRCRIQKAKIQGGRTALAGWKAGLLIVRRCAVPTNPRRLTVARPRSRGVGTAERRTLTHGSRVRNSNKPRRSAAYEKTGFTLRASGHDRRPQPRGALGARAVLRREARAARSAPAKSVAPVAGVSLGHNRPACRRAANKGEYDALPNPCLTGLDALLASPGDLAR